MRLTVLLRSRRGVERSSFDNGKPILFKLDSEIVEILATHHLPEGAAIPPITKVDSSTIGLGPASLHRDFQCVVTVLTSGPPTSVTPSNTVSAVTDILPLSAREPRLNISWSQLIGWSAAASLIFFVAYNPKVAAEVFSAFGAFFANLVG